jgi:hypothetical protein
MAAVRAALAAMRTARVATAAMALMMAATSKPADAVLAGGWSGGEGTYMGFWEH